MNIPHETPMQFLLL